MTKGFEKHRRQICDLYLRQNLSLKEVQEKMRERYNFDAGIRAYRYHIALWRALRKNNRRVSAPWSDSGYADESYRTSAATSPSTFWSENASISDVQTNLWNLTLQRSSTPTSIPSNAACATPVAVGSIQTPSPSNRLTFELRRDEGLPSPSNNPPVDPRAQSFTNVSTPTTQGAGPSGHVHRSQAPPTRPDSRFSPPGYSPPHAPPSRCRLARNNISVAVADPRSCPFCGATELHYLATVAYFLDKGVLAEGIQAASQRIHDNRCDIFENNPGHFLASSGPTMRHIESFRKAGIDLFKGNLDGETFLHVLDPVRLGPELPTLLNWFHDQRPGILTQRTHHGKTVLHCLLERPCFLDPSQGFDALLDILPIFQSVKNDINARDNQGSTAMGLFCAKWLAAKRLEERSLEELKTFYGILSTFAPDLTLVNLGGTQLSPITLCNGMMPSERAPTGRHSKDHSLANLELRDREMRDIIAESVGNPLAQDYRARNGLHCLASVIRPLPDTSAQQPLATRKEALVYLLNSGVDVNAFDSLGATPLHTFLSYPRHHREDSTIALFIKLMVLREHGADLHLRDRNGNNALHLACKSGRVPCVDILLALGANVDARNYHGRGAIAEAQLDKERSEPEDAAKIQQCIDLVRRAGGFDDPLEEEDLLYNQDRFVAV